MDIKGSGGGKGGGGQTFSEGENTLRSNVIVSTLEAWGEGPIVGPIHGLRSIYLNNTPIQNADNTYNFGGKVGVQLRLGLPVQDEVNGFEEAGNVVSVNTEVTQASPVVQTITDDTVTAIALTISLPQGLYTQDTNNNSLTGARVELAVDVKLTASGTWEQQRLITYDDKTTSPYQETFTITLPPGASRDVRLRRISDDDSSSTVRTNSWWAFYTELRNVGITYPNVAYMAVQLDASSVNTNQIPTRSAEIYGLIVQIPSNFNGSTREYTGIWDGTFTNGWTNDPAWILYDLCTNTRYGMGRFGITEDQVDKYSFYAASVYNSEILSFTNRAGVTIEAPRFAFNYQISEGQLGPELLNRVASMMNAKVMWVGGQITVLQDRNEQHTHIFNKSNVIDGKFVYKGTALQQRNTVVNVTWNDPENQYQQRVTSVEDAAAIATYGYNPADIAAYGCTNEAQAIRFGRNFLYGALYQTETVTFNTGLEGQLVLPHEIIQVWDDVKNDGTSGTAGRLAAGSTTTLIKLDRPQTFLGAGFIDIHLPDGTLYADREITPTATPGELTISPPLPAAPPQYSTYITRSTSATPRYYRVSKVAEVEKGIYLIEANTHNSEKYAYVDDGVAMATPVFTAPISNVVPPPTDLFLNEKTVYVDNQVKRSVLVSWAAPTTGVVSRYTLVYRVAGGPQVTVRDINRTYYEIEAVTPGRLDVTVFAVSYKDVNSSPLRGSLNVSYQETTGSDLNAVTNLQVVGGGTTFTGRTLTVEWTNPTSNGTVNDSVADFKVEVFSGATPLRTEYVPSVTPGSVQTYTYDYDKNLTDGGPRRTVTIKVRARDGKRLLSAETSATFNNPVPDSLVNFDVVPGIGSLMVKWSRPTVSDFKGVLVWRDTTPGFTRTSGNLIADITGSFINENGLSAGVTYYYQAAAYDDFSRPVDGAGLNVVSDSGATLSNAGIPNGATNPLTGTEGDLFFNNTDGKLYRYHDGAWTAEVPTVDLVGSITSDQLGIGTVQTVNIAPAAVTGVKIANDSIAAAQLLDSAVTTVKIADLNITEGKIADAAITSTKIAAGAVTATQLAVTAGSGNLVGNGSFFGIDVTGKVMGWEGYPLTTDVTVSGGVTFNTTTSSQVGITTYNGLDGPYGGVGFLTYAAGSDVNLVAVDVGPSETVWVSFIAYRDIGATGITGFSIEALFSTTEGSPGSVVVPQGSWTAVVNPALPDYTNRVQYVFKTTGASFTNIPRQMNGIRILANGSKVATDRIVINSIMVEKGDLRSSVWSPRIEELLPGTIVADRIAAGAITTEKLAANSITGDKIQANTITSDKILSRQIVASSLTLTDLTNYISNGSFLSQTVAYGRYVDWSNSGILDTTRFEITNTGAPSPAPTEYYGHLKPYTTAVAVVNGSAVNSSGEISGVGSNIEASQDTPFRLKIWAAAGAGTVGSVTIQLIPFDASNSIAGAGASWALNPTTSWAEYTYEWTPPADTAYVTFQITRTSGTASVYFTKVELRKMNAAQLVVDGGIVTNKIAASAITADKVAANAITTVKLDASAVTADKIAANAIEADKIAANAVTTDKLAANSVVADKIAANAVTADKIAANSVEADKIAANAVTTDKLAANSVVAGKIAAASIETDKLAANAVTADKIAANTITAAQIAAATITSNEIAADTITAANIAAATITASEIAANAITTEKIAATSITTEKIVVGAATAAASSSSGGQSYGPTSGITELDTGFITMFNFTSTGAPLTLGGSFNLSFSTSAPAGIQYYIWELHIEVAGVTWTVGSGGGITPAMSIGAGSDHIMQIQVPATLRSPTPAVGTNPVRYKVKMQARYPYGGGTNPVTMTDAFLGVTWACWAQENKV